MSESSLSEFKVRVYLFAKNKLKQSSWFTAKECAGFLGIHERTVRAHCSDLVKSEVFNIAKISQGHRFRLSEMASTRNPELLKRLEESIELLGVN